MKILKKKVAGVSYGLRAQIPAMEKNGGSIINGLGFLDRLEHDCHLRT